MTHSTGGEPISLPILFCRDMILAYFAGTKTETRRKVRVQPDLEDCIGANVGEDGKFHWVTYDEGSVVMSEEGITPRYGLEGDLLWVKETTWKHPEIEDYVGRMIRSEKGWPRGGLYDADVLPVIADDLKANGLERRPSIFMPKDIARITLLNLGTTIEPLQDITRQQAIDEGIDHGSIGDLDLYAGWMGGPTHRDPIHAYRDLWDRINPEPPFNWESNPFVWRIRFPRYTGA